MKKWMIGLLLSSAVIPTSLAFADLGSILQTVQGVESDVKGSVNTVNGRALSVFKEEGIQSTGVSSENSGAKQILRGKKDNLDIKIEMTQSSPEQTHVSVTAKEGALNWNRDYAKKVLSKIIQSS